MEKRDITDATSKKWDEVVAAGDAEDKRWRWSKSRRAVLYNEEVLEQFQEETDWDVIYGRMEQLRKRAMATTMCAVALGKGLIGFRKIDQRIMEMTKIEEPNSLFEKPKKPSIMDITRMFG